MAVTDYLNLLTDPSVQKIAAGDLTATFLPRHGMLGASLRYKGIELLRRLENLEVAAQKGSTAGIPVLYPWANRLEALGYRVAGVNVVLSAASTLLHFDDRGLPMHGITWALLAWEVLQSTGESLVARLNWTRPEFLAVFPFPHLVEMTATIRTDGLLIETIINAQEESVPISFGLHPYFGLPRIPRVEWHLKLPPMQKLVLDPRGIPTGTGEPFIGFDALLGDSTFDDLFAVADSRPTFTLSGAGIRIVLEFLEGYGYAQIYAPRGKEFIALEPMTAPTNALHNGRGLHIVEPHGQYRAAFCVNVEECFP